MTASNCTSCGARVRWVMTSTGKSMPVDELPVEDGNVILSILSQPGGQGPLVARVVAKTDVVDVMTARFKSHFATCPDAAKHRRRK